MRLGDVQGLQPTIASDLERIGRGYEQVSAVFLYFNIENS